MMLATRASGTKSTSETEQNRVVFVPQELAAFSID
jgi:hypothetical protein